MGSLATVVESTLVENLSTPSRIADTSWIRPGRAGWSWRAGANQADFNAHLGFVDLAASLGWEYYLVDEGWQASWVPSLVSYASARNVGIWLWVEDETVKTEAQMRARFSQFVGWGVRGVKIDFFDGDTQATMQLYDKLAQVAAEFRLLVNFHGCTKPNGLERKWPNLLTREAVFGAEQGPLPAAHNVSLVYTRNAIGPMDYTPVVYSNTGSTNTWAHQTALAVVFASYVQHPSDHWAAYRDSVAREFLRAVPTTWEETRLVGGNPADLATVARRRADEWYLGSISSGAARTITVPLSFLSPGTTFTAHLYRDGNSDNEIAYETRPVTSADVLSVPVRTNGGFAVRLTTRNVPVVPEPVYRIVNRNSGKALAVLNAATNDTAPVIQWTYTDDTTRNDEWRIVDIGGGSVSILNRRSGRTLDVSGGSTTAGAAVIQFSSRGSANQQWQIVDAGGGFRRIVSRQSGMVLDVTGAAATDGAAVIQWPSNGGTNQQWQLVQVDTIP
jgi:alpha-glucosidase